MAPNRAIDPGLVYDAGKADFVRYQCKVNKPAVSPASDCTTYGTLDQTYNFNLPSITVGAVGGTTLVTRTVTNVSTGASTYSATAALPGFTVVVAPPTLTLLPGETKSFTVALTTAGSPEGAWAYGSLVWSAGVHTVKSPITARAGKTIISPALVTATTTSGSRLMTLQTNFSGRMTANKGGLKPVTMGASTALTPSGPVNPVPICSAGVGSAAVKVYPVSIPADTIVARFELRDADVGTPGDDNDLMIVAPGGSYVYSGNNGSNEMVQLVNPAAGNYKVCVHAYAGAASMTHSLSSWVVTAADASSNFNVLLPSTSYMNSTSTVGLSWSGLSSGGRYLGGAQFKDTSGGVQSTTLLMVDTTGAAPLAYTQKAVSAEQLGK